MEKVTSIQALLVDNLLENCGHFLINNKDLVVFNYQWWQACIIYPQLIYFCSKISNVLEKSNLDQFYMIRKYVNMRIFLNPKNWLADKNLLFPCLKKMLGYDQNCNNDSHGISGIQFSCGELGRINSLSRSFLLLTPSNVSQLKLRLRLSLFSSPDKPTCHP